MVYESDFSRRQYLNSCAESGLFHSSPDYKPQGYLSKLRPPTTSTSPLTNSRSERTARLLASLSTNTQPLTRFDPQPQTRQSFDPEHPYTTSEANGNFPNGNSDGIRHFRFPASQAPQRSCCGCCHGCGGGGPRGSSVGRYAPPESVYPTGGSNFNTQQGMESYIKSRRPILDSEEPFQIKPKSTYSVRSIPVRSLDELRETVAIRRNYIKERQQMLDEGNGALSLPFLDRMENSASPQPDGSIVTYPSDEKIVDKEVIGPGIIGSGGGSYYEVQEAEMSS